MEQACQKDPSLAVAHGCFWKYHTIHVRANERHTKRHNRAPCAWQWELQLQDELHPRFVLEETNHENLRTEYLENHPDDALVVLDREINRRFKIRNKFNKHNPKEKQKTIDSITLLHPGLWRLRPQQMKGLELKYTKKYNVPFFIYAPDKPLKT